MKCKSKKYYVTFVPHFDSVGEWGKRRLTARRDGQDEFALKKAKSIVKFLKKRKDKAIKINCVK